MSELSAPQQDAAAAAAAARGAALRALLGVRAAVAAPDAVPAVAAAAAAAVRDGAAASACGTAAAAAADVSPASAATATVAAAASAASAATSGHDAGAARRGGRAGCGAGGARSGPPTPPAPSRPTHFLALRLSHAPSVTRAIETVQQSLVAHHPSLEAFLEPPVKAHLTLAVMALTHGGGGGGGYSGLTSQARLVECLRRMAALPDALRSAGADGALHLRLRGLASFGSRVLFLEVDNEQGPQAACAPDASGGSGEDEENQESATNTNCARLTGRDAVMQLQSVVADHFRELRFEEGGRPFSPHVTVAKVRYVPPHASHGGRGGRGGNRANAGRGAATSGSAAAATAGSAAEGAAPAADAPAAAAGGAAATAAKAGADAEEAAAGGGVAGEGPTAAGVTAAAAQEAPVTRTITDEAGNRIIDVTSPAPGASTAAGARAPSTPRPCAKPLKSIPREAYEAHLDIDAGNVVVDRVQLCAMSGRAPGGYYVVLSEVALAAATPGGSGGGGGGGEPGPPSVAVWMADEARALLQATEAAEAAEAAGAEAAADAAEAACVVAVGSGAEAGV